MIGVAGRVRTAQFVPSDSRLSVSYCSPRLIVVAPSSVSVPLPSTVIALVELSTFLTVTRFPAFPTAV
jgi:hypothetical protein